MFEWLQGWLNATAKIEGYKHLTDHRLASIFYVGIGVGALCLGVFAPMAAAAQVLEIDPSGVVIVHDRPEVTSAAGATAILPTKSLRDRRMTPAADIPGLNEAAAGAELSPALVEAVAWRESGFRRDALSPAGAIGEMQLMPGTARDLGVDPHDSRQNYSGGAAYLSSLLKRYNGDMMLALAAYNAGPKAVDRYGGVPPFKETQDYVASILDRLSRRVAATPER